MKMKNTAVVVVAIVTLVLLVPALPAVAQEQAKLSISESGVGSGVEERSLVGVADRFRVGDQVWFWTRVTGGEDGDRIRHVWLQDGEEKLSVGLTLGGSHWRTWTRKTMHPGSAGAWTVEARDMAGNVLATTGFVCVAPEG
jgi:hypothetical protein